MEGGGELPYKTTGVLVGILRKTHKWYQDPVLLFSAQYPKRYRKVMYEGEQPNTKTAFFNQ